MTYGMSDVVQRRRMIDEGEAPDEIKRIERGKLDALLAVCETTECRRQAILGHFGEDHPGDCGNCDTCLTPAETWDGTEAAIKALAAIYRTGQRFGAGHIIDVLVGKETEKVLLNGHHTQPVFGKGNELDAKGWQSVIRQLAARVYRRRHRGLRRAAARRAGARRVQARADGDVAQGPAAKRAAETRRALRNAVRAARACSGPVRGPARRAQQLAKTAGRAALRDLPRLDIARDGPG